MLLEAGPVVGIDAGGLGNFFYCGLGRCQLVGLEGWTRWAGLYPGSCGRSGAVFGNPLQLEHRHRLQQLLGLAFQAEPDYVAPRWPEEECAQQKMLHLDFLVDDLEEACAHALSCGAKKAPRQFYEGVAVFFDPDGHPFCLFVDPAERQ